MITAFRRLMPPLYIITIVLVVLGLFLRLYHRDQAMYYMNDQGLLLLTTYDILFSHHMPRVGPPISLPGVSIPPFMYAIVAVFELVGSSPLTVAAGYMVLNMAAGIALAYYASLVLDKRTGLITLALVMVSAAMVENGRSIWQAHPSFFFVVMYLMVTEVAYRKKHIWLYCIGLFLYAVSVASYPTPLLLLFFVFARTTAHFRSFGGWLARHSVAASFLAVFGILGAVIVPWAVRDMTVSRTTTASFLTILFSSISSLPHMIYVLYSYASHMMHDLFQLWVFIPSRWIGSLWIKIMAAGFVILAVLTYTKRIILSGVNSFLHSQYVWLFPGLVIPAVFGMRMPAYRLLPFYSFVFVLFAWWIGSWISSPRLTRRFIIRVVILLYVVGNGLSWWSTTIAHPRREYEAAMRIANTISSDVVIKRLPISDVGVHYFTPMDTYDYYAAPLYYLLHRSIGYPVSYTPSGNELDRGRQENRAFIYLVCDGFGDHEEIRGCIQPYLTRWSFYTPVHTYTVSNTTQVVVFERSPLERGN